MAFTPFASAYAPVDALATRQMQINATEQARQLEMQRMLQAERQTQAAAMLQQKQLQDTQAAREMQAALSFRQQAAQEAQHQAVLQDAIATRNAQLGWNEKELTSRERMQGEQLKSAKEIAGMNSKLVDPRVAQFNLERETADFDRRAKVVGAVARANAALDKAVYEDVYKEKESWIHLAPWENDQTLKHLADKTKRADVEKRRNKLRLKIQSELPADVLGVLKWNEATFQWEPAFETGKASEPKTPITDRLNSLSSVGPFDDFQVSFDAPIIPNGVAANSPAIIAPQVQLRPSFSGQSAIPQNPAFEVFPGASRIPATPGWTPFSGQRIMPEIALYRPTNRAEYEAVPDGAKFVNPSDGKTYTKKSSAK